MTKYLLWRWGLKGPSPAIITSTSVDEYDRRYKLKEAIPLKPEEENLPFAELAKLYPPPANEDPK